MVCVEVTDKKQTFEYIRSIFRSGGVRRGDGQEADQDEGELVPRTRKHQKKEKKKKFHEMGGGQY